jgi:DNA-binding NarL/FixJ family response regulator
MWKRVGGVHQGIATLLCVEPDMALVAEAANGREAIQQFRTHRPDVTLMNRRCPGWAGSTPLLDLGSGRRPPSGNAPQNTARLLGEPEADAIVVSKVRDPARHQPE